MREDLDVAENMNFTSHDYTDNFMYNNVWDLNVDSFAVETNDERHLIYLNFCFVLFYLLIL